MNSNETVSIEVISSGQELQTWQKQWLNAFQAGSSLDLSASYHSLFHDFKSLTTEHEKRYVYILHRNQNLLALIAVRQSSLKLFDRLPIKNLTTGGHFVSDMFIADTTSDAELITLFQKLFNDFPGHSWINMTRVTPQQFRRFSEWAKESDMVTYSCIAGNYYCFDVGGNSFDTYFQTLGKKTRSNMKYYQRLLEREQGSVTYEFVKPDSDEANHRMFKLFVELEHAGWKGKHNSSILERPASYAYHQSMSQSACASNQMLWACCRVNNQLIAMLYVITRGDKLWAVKIAYNESFSRYSPGALLTLKLIEYGYNEPDIKCISMMTHYDWVKRWKPITENYYGIRIFSDTLKASLMKQLLKLKNDSWQPVNAE